MKNGMFPFVSHGKRYNSRDELEARVAELREVTPDDPDHLASRKEQAVLRDMLSTVDALAERDAYARSQLRAGRSESLADGFNREQNRAIRPGRSEGNQMRDLGLRAIDNWGGFLSARAADRLEDVVNRDPSGAESRGLNAVLNPLYKEGFLRKLVDPYNAVYDPDVARAMHEAQQVGVERALTIGSGTLPLPGEYDPTIRLTSNGAINPLRQKANVSTITHYEWVGVTSAGTTAAFSAEASEVSDNTPTLALQPIVAQKAQSYTEFSIEAGMDQATLGDELAKAIADAKDVLEADKFITGSGTNEPEGLVQGLAAGSLVTAAGTASFTTPDLYSVQNALPARHSPVAEWLSSLTVANLSWQFVAAGDTSKARVWNDDRTQLLGKPWSEVSTMATTLTSGNKILAYGNIQAAFKIVDRIGLNIEVVPLVLGTNRRPLGTRALYSYWRVGSGVLVDNAVRLLKTG